MENKLTLRSLLALQGAVILYSFADVAAKLASAHPFLSGSYVLWIGTEILILGVYALCWQQFIRRVVISGADANRAAAVVWTTLWAALLFRETITLRNMAGICILFAGIWMVNRDE